MAVICRLAARKSILGGLLCHHERYLGIVLAVMNLNRGARRKGKANRQKLLN
jgi:hypothetical protein